MMDPNNFREPRSITRFAMSILAALARRAGGKIELDPAEIESASVAMIQITSTVEGKIIISIAPQEGQNPQAGKWN